MSSTFNQYKEASESNEIDWDEFVLDVKDFIVSTYNNGALSKFKGEWKRRFKIMAETMGYTIGSTSGDVDSWRLVEEELKKIKSKTKSTSGSSTVSSNYAVTEEEKQKILYQYSKQADSKKWILSTGKIVEDTMKAVVENSKFEHPVFSFILDPSDLTWFKHFTKEELNEIRSHRGVNLPKVKEDFQKYLDSFDNPDFQTADDFYDYAKEQKFPLREYEKRWAQETFVSVAQLFAECDILSLNDFSEHDMLHQIWPFAYKLFSGSNIKAKLGERCSVANSLRRNEGRCLESELRRAPKKIGAKVDMLFQEGAHELGCCEVGKSNVAIVDNKYLDDGMLKQPKILRDILSALISVNPSKINDLYSVGFLMMGLSFELVIIDVPVGNLVTRVTRTEKYNFPEHVANLAVDLLPLLEITWIGKEMMKNTTLLVNNRKRKSIALSNSTSSEIPPSFFCKKE